MFQEFLAGASLGVFPAIGLMIFLFSFAAVLAHFLFGRKGRFDRIARLPLEEDDMPVNDSRLEGRRSGR